MNLVNLTPHALNIHLPTGEVVTYPSNGVARVEATREAGPTFLGIPSVVTTFGEVTGLPAPAAETIYVVSALVQNHPSVVHREDVYSPNDLVRDEEQKVIGARGLTRTAVAA